MVSLVWRRFLIIWQTSYEKPSSVIFLAEKKKHITKKKNPYYSLRDTVEVCERILDEFEVTGENRHIINGHTPVKRTKGESPIKANGTLLVIDGGFFKNLIRQLLELLVIHYCTTSFGLQLTAHKSFSSKETAILNNQDIHSIKQVIDRPLQRLLVKDTTIGKRAIKAIASTPKTNETKTSSAVKKDACALIRKND